jgi:hypothetical protein
LKKMSDFLAKQQSFSVQTKGSLIKAEANNTSTKQTESKVALRRPDRFFVERKGAGRASRVFYDGKTLTAAAEGANVYASAPAPGTIDETLDQAEDALGWVPAAADLLYSNPYKVLTEELQSGRCVGPSKVAGANVQQLAFKGPRGEWKIWIEDGANPLPRKLQITPADDKGVTYTVEMSSWSLGGNLDEAMFHFTPPQGAEKVGFLAPEMPGRDLPQAQGRKGTKP